MSKTKIIQCIVPELTAGEYSVSVKQTLQAGKDVQFSDKEFKFGVDAARFTISSNEIYSVYPPESTTGDFSHHLPHVVFNRRTLPWERTIDGELPGYKRNGKEPEECPPVPWMALLIFTETEMQRSPISETKLAEIITKTSEKDTITKPTITKDSGALKLMPWEKEDQQCYTIDITKEQFNNSIPKLDDLPYLAHSKKVSINHKDQNGIEDSETSIKQETFTIKAFSSEDSTEKENTDKPRNENVEVTKEQTEGEAYFSVLMGNRLITQKGAYTAVLVSLEGYSDYISTPPQKTIETDTVRLVVLAHWQFNNFGSKTFKSLLDNIEVKSMQMDASSATLKPYLDHGYLPMKHFMRNGSKNISWYRGPFVPNKIGFDSFEFQSHSSSDDALRYDNNTGLLDVSIAAAWELGKILALQNKEFTKAIVDWNSNPIDNPYDRAQKEIYTAQEVKDWLEEKTLRKKEKVTGFVSYKPYPDEVIEFLKELACLKGVPTSYLIPDKKYLESHKAEDRKDALTVFYIDPLWIYALLEGATSLLSKGHTQTKYNLANIIQEVYYFNDQNAMGFLLNSSLVSGWRGIEIKAYNTSPIPLDFPIRFERILPDVFLGIFPTTITKLEVIQPYEGLHFGLKEEGKTAYSKSVKDHDGKTSPANKVVLNNDGLIKQDVINVKQLSIELKKRNKEANFTSAEYAYQMVDSPILATFHINQTNQ